MPKIVYPAIVRRLSRTTDTPGQDTRSGGESSAADAAPGRARRLEELGYVLQYMDDLATAILMDEEARLSRAAWAQSMDACDQVRSEGISLRTMVMAQQSEITRLQAATEPQASDDRASETAGPAQDPLQSQS
ncbi:hypothetical protein Tco_0110626 [Tanacetum coccineum]